MQIRFQHRDCIIKGPQHNTARGSAKDAKWVQEARTSVQPAHHQAAAALRQLAVYWRGLLLVPAPQQVEVHVELHNTDCLRGSFVQKRMHEAKLRVDTVFFCNEFHGVIVAMLLCDCVLCVHLLRFWLH